MNTSSLYVIETMSWIITAFAGILAAFFELLDRMQTENDRQRTRTDYRKIWQTIQQTGILQLPEKTIIKFLTIKTILPNKFLAPVDKFIDFTPKWLSTAAFIISPVIAFAAGWFASGWILALLLCIPMTVIIATFILVQITELDIKSEIIEWMAFVYISFWLPTGLAFLKIILDLNIFLAALVMLVSLPFYGYFVVGMPLSLFADTLKKRLKVRAFKNPDIWIFIGLTIVISFFLTLMALLIGYIAAPHCWIPKTMQMLGSNVIFDGLTMLITIVILSQAVLPRRRFPIPFAVFLDVVVAAVLACASLYCGVAFTERHISVIATAQVLIGLSPDTGTFELGPYFWAMHTTFIPTLIYLLLILFCWTGKLLILPIASFFSRSVTVEKPHHLTAGMFLFIAAVFGVISKGVDTLGNKVDGNSQIVKSTKNVSVDPNTGKTALNIRTKERVEELKHFIIKEKIDSWLFRKHPSFKVTKDDGSVIEYSNLEYAGSVINIFWSKDYIDTFLSKGIKRILDETGQECRTNGLRAEEPLKEAAALLNGIIWNIYDRMAEVDFKLRKQRGDSEAVFKKNVDGKIKVMDEKLREHLRAALELYSDQTQ